MRPPRYHRFSGQSRPVSHAARLRPPAAVAAPQRSPLRVVADLSAKGRAILPKSLTVQRIMGEGSFGQVFEGGLNTPAGNQRVVLKRVKTRVQGAEAMSQMEHLLNVYASRVARGHCADFLGYCEVADSEATTRLTSGLWLVWKYEGSRTLAYYLRRRDTLRALATDMQVPEEVVVPTVMKHVFDGLAAFHAAGLVHRDLKPLNMIFAEDVQRFKLIDLGACADLRTGTNYVPEESILDLNFCPPEQYVLPTDSPHIARQAGLLKLAISPMLWAKHKPDRFDTWSAGIVLLQLAVPAMRTDRALRAFNQVYGPKYKYDLAAWRKATHLPSRDCALLDADDGAGWDLLQSLLAPRHIQVDENGGVSFVNDTPFSRISAYEALKHRYIKNSLGAASAPALAGAGGMSSRNSSMSVTGSLSSSDTSSRKGRGGQAATAPEPATAAAGASSSGPGGDPLSSALGIWRDVTGRLFDLEARIMRQTSATELQTTTVRRLKEQVETGKADPSVLQKEEKVLNKMQARLAGLQQDFTSTANQATGIFSFFGLGSKREVPAADNADKAKSSIQALRAAEAASAPSSASTSQQQQSPVASAAGMFNSVWERLSNRLGDLEQKLSNQASATERQSLVVRGLRAKVRAGEAEPEMLSKAERTLSRMERRLLDLDRDYKAVKQNAKGALAGKVSVDADGRKRSGSGEQSVQGVAEAVAAANAALQPESDNGIAGSFWSRLLGPSGRSKAGSSGSSMDGSTRESTAPAAAGQSQAGWGLPRSSPPPSPSTPAPQPKQAQPQQALAQPPQPTSQQQQNTQQSGLQPEPRSLAFPRSISPSALFQQRQPQAAPQQQQQGGGSGGYKSIFGGGGGGSAAVSKGAAASGTPTASPRSTSPRNTTGSSSTAAGAATDTGTSGGSGFFGGLFSRPKNQPAQAAPQPSSSSSLQQRQVGGSRAGSSATPSATSSTSGPVVPPPAAAASAAGGDALVEGANRVIKSSLGFTGLAAKIAGDLATAFKADAERYLKDMELQEAAKRQQRTLDLAFLALLREAQPPVLSTTSFEGAAARFGAEARWAALANDDRRRELYGKFLIAAKKVEEQAAAAAEAGFRAALRRYDVAATSQWSDFQAELPASDPTLTAVTDPARRQQLFLEVVAELQLQAALQAASQKVELEFTTMLADLRDPRVTSTSTWALVRKAVAADPRCQALPERRRRELFEAYTAKLFEDDTRRVTEATLAVDAAVEAPTPEVPFPVLEVPSLRPGTELPASVPVVHAAAAAAAESEATAVAAVSVAPAAVVADDVSVFVDTVAGDEVVVVVDQVVVAAMEPVAPVPAAAGSFLSPPEVVTAAEAFASSPLGSDEDVAVGPTPPSPQASATIVGSSVGVDDDDLSAALAGMEAALETAIKAVSSAPVPSHSLPVNGVSMGVPGVGSGGGNNIVRVPPSQLQSAVPRSPGGYGADGVPPVNGVVMANGVKKPQEPAGGGSGAPFDGVRLDDLRKEQARLRAEYEAMAQRLREMEERLKSQAQLMAAVDDDKDKGKDKEGANGSTARAQAPQAAEKHSLSLSDNGNGNGSNGTGNGSNGGSSVPYGSSSTIDNDLVSSNGTFVPARGQRWR